MFCIVVDITNSESLKHFSFWFDRVKDVLDQKKTLGVLLGNKIDLENRRQVTQTMAKQIAEKHGLKYFECSAVGFISALFGIKLNLYYIFF